MTPSGTDTATGDIGWRDAEAIRAAAQDVLSRPGYDLERGAERPSVEWVGEWLSWMLAPIRWLFDLMEGIPDGFRWVLIVLLLLLVLVLVFHIAWTLAQSLAPPRLAALNLPAHHSAMVDPAVLEAEARQLAAEGDHVSACRRLLQAALGWLQIARERRFRPGVTNTELLREYAASSVAAPLRQLVSTVELKWYGDEPCLASDYEQCDASHAHIRRAVEEKRDAVGA